MLSYRLLCVGRRARDPLLDAAEEYLERLGRYARVDLIRVRDSDPAREAKELLGKVRPGDHLVALDERGAQLDTRALAGRVQAWQGAGEVALVVGGADGLAPTVRARAEETLALSRLTLPHRLALALLCEQLYRAHTILKGEPYHRD